MLRRLASSRPSALNAWPTNELCNGVDPPKRPASGSRMYADGRSMCLEAGQSRSSGKSGQRDRQRPLKNIIVRGGATTGIAP